MNFFMILKVALRAIWRNKTRSLLTALGIIVGIAAVIAVVSIGQGASTMMVNQINSMGNNMIMIFPASRNTGGVRTGSGGAQTLTAEDGDAIAEDISYYVRCVSPIVRANGQVIYQENNWATQIQGVSVDFPEVRNWNVAKGVFFDKGEQRQGSRVCVIGQTVSDNLFGENDPIGKVIRIKNMPFKVLGVMEKKGSNNFGQDQDDLIIAPYTTVKRVLQNSIFNNVNMLNVSLYSLDDTEAAKKDISALLRQRHKLGRNADDDFDLRDMAEISILFLGDWLTQDDRLRLQPDDHPADDGCGNLAGGRRYRHHEHHAGIGDGTYARNRAAHGDRRDAVRHPDAVHRGVDPALHRRRLDRRDLRCGGRENRGGRTALADSHHDLVDSRLLPLQRDGRRLLRVLPGVPRLAPPPHRLPPV